ncbi:MAG: hypothetical protein ACOH2Q_17955 [Rhodococcus sp. (in: high G+C Gram-positive bacteria)]
MTKADTAGDRIPAGHAITVVIIGASDTGTATFESDVADSRPSGLRIAFG